MRRSEALRADPFQKLEIAHQDREILSAAVQHEILMLAESTQVYGLAVKQQLLALDADRAQPDRKRIFVNQGMIADADRQVVKERIVGAPGAHCRNPQGSDSGAARYDKPRIDAVRAITEADVAATGPTVGDAYAHLD